VNYEFTPEAKTSPLNQVLESILESHQKMGRATNDRIVAWVREVNRRFEEYSLPSLTKLSWAETPKMDMDEATHENRWFLNQGFTNIISKAELLPHTWFNLVRDKSLPDLDSDLASMAPKYFWSASDKTIDLSSSRAFKFKANRAAKCMALAAKV
jgi:hypothetical protein